MDVNGTRFQLLLGYDDWAACSQDGRERLGSVWELSRERGSGAGVVWDEQRGALTMRKHLFHFVPSSGERALTLDRRRGAGRDRFGNWYWIDDTRGRILVKSSGTGNTTSFWTRGDGAVTDGQGRFGDFGPEVSAQPPAPFTLSGLAVTEDHYLVVGVLKGAGSSQAGASSSQAGANPSQPGAVSPQPVANPSQAPAGLLIFDLHTPGPPRQLVWPVEFAPFDISPAPSGGVWILDRNPDDAGAGARYWALDRAFNVIRQDAMEVDIDPGGSESFGPADGSPPGGASPHQAPAILSPPGASERMFPAGISLQASSPIGARHPVAIEGLPDSTVLILDSDPAQSFSSVYRYRFGRQLGEPVSTGVVMDVMEDPAFGLLGYDFAFVPEQRDANGTVLSPDRLYVTGADGVQSIVFDIAAPDDVLTLKALPMYLPMRHFGGKGLVTAGDQVYYDFGTALTGASPGWIPLVEQPRSQYEMQAFLYTPIAAPGGEAPVAGRGAFDGKEPDCVWHRLIIDACIPHETSIHVSSRTANDQHELAVSAWQPEPTLYCRTTGSELPFASGATGEGSGTWELLFQAARGRYLQLRFLLTSNGRSTPTLRAVRAYYPRFSYLAHYLPGAYATDGGSASFLDRFLANIEGFYTDIEDRIANVQILFDPRSAPPDVLPWLAGWFGLALDPAWDDTRRRLFIKHAMTFFQYRGTIRGIMMALRVALDACPDESIFSDRPNASSIRIVEKYLTRRGPGVIFGDPTDASGLRITPQTDRWQPSAGRLDLCRRYGTFLHAVLPDRHPADIAVEFPLTAPTDATEAAAWQQFSQTVLGFIPSATSSDPPPYRRFLARRYGYAGALNDRYGAAGLPDIATFTEAELPASLPPDGAPLQDWYEFQTIVLPMRRNAHRFTVLVPASGDATPDEHRRRLELAQRVTDLEKPAHTVFDVKSYWSAFIVGEVRLGTDTLIDLGVRSPQFMSAMVLGQGYLVEAYLAPGHPQDAPDRQILGRDRLGQ